MLQRAARLSTGLVLGLLAGAGAARAQGSGFEIRSASPPRVAPGAPVQIRWTDQMADAVDEGLTSITWYYASRPDGHDRKRISTRFRDDFRQGYVANWRAEGRFIFDWIVREDRSRRPARLFLAGNRDAGRILSRAEPERDTVLSVLLRPRGGAAGEFGVGVRIQPGGRGYEARVSRGCLQLYEGGQKLSECLSAEVLPRNWYWLEIGTRGRKGDVELRLRVYDEKREMLLAGLTHVERPSDRRLLRPGLVGLWGSADFAEVYTDPWECRWTDDGRNELRWDTSDVPPGRYHVVAEVLDCRGKHRLVVSEFQVQVGGEESPDIPRDAPLSGNPAPRPAVEDL